MRPFLWCAILFLAAPARAEAPPKLVKEAWDTAYVEGARCGYFHRVASVSAASQSRSVAWCEDHAAQVELAQSSMTAGRERSPASTTSRTVIG